MILATNGDQGVVYVGKKAVHTETQEEFLLDYGLAFREGADWDACIERVPSSMPRVTQGIWLHFKGNLYEVMDTVALVGRPEEPVEPMVLYRPLYGDEQLFLRPKDMWETMIPLPSGKVPRFRLV